MEGDEKGPQLLLFGTGRAGGAFSLACAAGLDGERAWMVAGSHASPKRKRGRPRGPDTDYEKSKDLRKIERKNALAEHLMEANIA